MKSLPAFKQEQREAFRSQDFYPNLGTDEQDFEGTGTKEILESFIDSTAQYVLENCVPENRIATADEYATKDSSFIQKMAYNNCREAFLAKARELGIK